jgi:hypothetical protein
VDVPTFVSADPREVARLPTGVREALKGTIKKRLETDPYAGDRIRQELWPRQFRGFANLFRLELPEAHRAVYTVLTFPGRPREVRIVWLGHHKKYDRLFGYSTS